MAFATLLLVAPLGIYNSNMVSYCNCHVMEAERNGGRVVAVEQQSIVVVMD